MALVAVTAVAGGYFGYRHWLQNAKVRQAVSDLRQLRLPDPQGSQRALSQWQGKVLLVNFWATWCEPCREEVPALLRARRKYASHGLEVVGVAVDSAAKVREFAAEFRIDYPLVIGGLEAIDLTRRLGNGLGVLPYTVVLDRSGTMVLAHLGVLTDAQLEAALGPLFSSGVERRSTSGIWWTKWPHLSQDDNLWPCPGPPPDVKPPPSASWSCTDPT